MTSVSGLRDRDDVHALLGKKKKKSRHAASQEAGQGRGSAGEHVLGCTGFVALKGWLRAFSLQVSEDLGEERWVGGGMCLWGANHCQAWLVLGPPQ